jgi:hypothetical protein
MGHDPAAKDIAVAVDVGITRITSALPSGKLRGPPRLPGWVLALLFIGIIS